MKYSLKIFTVFGIPVELHISFLLLMVIIYAAALLNAVAYVNLATAVLITLVFVTVVLHELSHSYVAQRYGVVIERIILIPIGGISEMKELPKDPHQELRIALAGPLVNFVIAGLCYPLLLILGNSVSADVTFLLYNFILVNLLLGAFNLLPAFPMDGGRVLRAFLAERMNFIRATELAATIGKELAIIMAIVGILIFLNPFLVLIAIFVYMGADQEYRTVMVNTLLAGLHIRDIMTSEVKTVNPGDSVSEVLKTMFHHRHMGYPVSQDEDLLGIVTFHDLSRVPEDERNLPVQNFMTKKLVVTNPEEDVTLALERLTRNRVGRLPVLKEGKLVGIVSKTDIMKALDMMKTRAAG
jgi:Zn-dependent protease/CBS domain-containing protein